MSEQIGISDFIVTARKWRPLKFADVVGQDHVNTTLQNAIKSDRVHHAYLFSGPRGVGKTTTARILARAINCKNPKDGEPCNECDNCLAVLENKSLDIIEIDGASNNGVDDVRKLRDNARYAPTGGRYKMYIIDEVHMLTTAAFNALLKTLEEPPKHLLFVFATTEVHKVPATILSRCQRFDFRRMELETIVKQLKFIASKEVIKIDEDSLLTIAKKADGSMRDSQSIFDQVVAFCGKSIRYSEMAEALNLIDQDFFFKLTDAMKAGDVAAMFDMSKSVIDRGYDIQECLQGLLEHLRNILTVVVSGNTVLIETSLHYLEKYKSAAKDFTKSDIIRMMHYVNNAEQALKYSAQPRIRFELVLVRLASMDKALDLAELIKDLKELKENPESFGSDIKKKAVTEPAPEDVPESGDIKIRLGSPTEVQSASAEKSWDGFIKFCTAKNSIFTLLKSITHNFVGNDLILKSEQGFLLDSIKSSLGELKELSNEYFDNKVNIRIVEESSTENKGDVSQNDKHKGDNSSDAGNSSVSPTDSDLMEIEKEIISLFGARKISED